MVQEKLIGDDEIRAQIKSEIVLTLLCYCTIIHPIVPQIQHFSGEMKEKTKLNSSLHFIKQNKNSRTLSINLILAKTVEHHTNINTADAKLLE